MDENEISTEQYSKKNLEDEQTIANYENSIINASKVAKAVPHPIAKVIGAAVLVADQKSNGESTRFLAEETKDINTYAPHGKKIEKLSNKLSESGVGDKIGAFADVYSTFSGNGNTSSTAANAATKTSDAASKATNAATKTSDAASKATNAVTNNSDTAGKVSNASIKGNDVSLDKNNLSQPQQLSNANQELKSKDNQSINEKLNKSKNKNLNSIQKDSMAQDEMDNNNPELDTDNNNDVNDNFDEDNSERSKYSSISEKFWSSFFKGLRKKTKKIHKKVKIMRVLVMLKMLAPIIIILLIFVFLASAAKDFANFDLTNSSEAMGNYSPQSIGVVSTDTIVDIGETTIEGSGGKILSRGETLYSIMGEEGVKLLNQTIQTSAQMAGYGTGAAPAAAAQALIQNLLNIGVILPYFWGGGHDTIVTGVDGNWGTYTKVTASGSFTTYSRRPLGLDCSGFVSWALYNGGCKKFTPRVAANFKNLGLEISFQDAKMGDIAASDSHVVLILENRGDKLLVAEAKSYSDGIVFTLKNEKNLKNYKIVDMSSYYRANCS